MSLPKHYHDKAGALREELIRRKARGEQIPRELEVFLSGAVCPYCGNTQTTLPSGSHRFARCVACGKQWHALRAGEPDLAEFVKAVAMVALVGFGLKLITDLLED